MDYWVPPDSACSVCQALPDEFETCPTCGFLVCCTDECLQDHLARTCPRRQAVIEASLLGKDDVMLRTRHNQSSCERSLTDTPDYPLMKAQAATARECPNVSKTVIMKSLGILARVINSNAARNDEDELVQRGRRAVLEAHQEVDGVYSLAEPITNPMEAPMATPMEPRVIEDLMDKIKSDSSSSTSAASVNPALQDLVGVVTSMAEALQDKV